MPEVFRLTRCESTMFEAARLARDGAPHGTAVVADEQTAGQGRLGRAWHSEPGAGLYVSVVLRVASSKLLTLGLGVATAEAIERTCAVVCDLRWPNDVLIRGRKCAGMLVNAENGFYVAGIGVNVNHAAFPPELAAIATSLRIETGREQSREALLTHLLHAIQDPHPDVLAEFSRRSTWVRGKRVIVEDRLHGITDGLDEEGFLWLREDSGARTKILAGGVREE